MPPKTPPSPSSRKIHYANAAAAIALLPLTIGLVSTISPSHALTILSFPTSSPTSTPQDRATIVGLSRLFGARDAVVGLSSLCVWYFGNARRGSADGCAALGALMMVGIGLAGVDGVASRDAIGKGEWNHWVFMPVGAVLGGGLFGWW